MDSEVNLETPLARWMRETNTSAYEVAKQARLSYKYVLALRDHTSFPSLITAYKLERLTKGAVHNSMWLDTPLGRAQWARGHDWEHWQEQRREEFRRNGPDRRKRAKQAAAVGAP